MRNPESLPFPPETSRDLLSFAWQMRGKLGGHLLAVVAQRPSWPVPAHGQQWINLLLLVADSAEIEAEKSVRSDFLRSNPKFLYPVEVTGYGAFEKKLSAGEPTVVYVCATGYPVYEADGAFEYLRRHAVDRSSQVDAQDLSRYLEDKSKAHFRNVRFRLAALLNEVYMGAMAGMARRLLRSQGAVEFDTLARLAQWDEIKRLADGRSGSVDLSSIERILDDIRALLAVSIDERQRKGTHHARELLETAAELARSLGIDPAG